jgi:hypothetical protein
MIRILAVFVGCCILLYLGMDYFSEKSQYKIEEIEGFRVHIHPEIDHHPPEAKAFRFEMRSSLRRVVATVPDGPLAKIRNVPIWVDWRHHDDTKFLAVYNHSSAELAKNGEPSFKARSISVPNAVYFTETCRKTDPWLIMHELAHAYHYCYLSDQFDSLIHTAYQQAMDRQLYQHVRYVDGRWMKAYASTNRAEYFAELSESYFGKNNYFPFNRDELRDHDPVGHDLMVRSWGEPKRRLE